MQTATETRRAMTITYRSNKALYVNLTNRCPCACTFCIRNNDLGVFGSDSLWLEREPTERLEVLLAAAEHLKQRDASLRIRVNTNGLSDLVNGKPTAALFAGKVDSLSISLNTDDPAEYLALCRPKFGEAAYPAMLKFTKEAAAVVPEVVMTVVGEPVTSLEKQARCRAIAEGLGARFRVRAYEAG